MNITLARTYLAVLDLRNFNRAAEYLNVTQSTVTTRINSLESLVGQRLFHRSRSGVEPTDAGQRFRTYAEMIIQIWKQAQQDLLLPNARSTQFKFAAESALWPGLAKDFLKKIYRDNANISVLVENKSADAINSCLAQGIYDAALLYDVRPRTNVVFEYLFEEQLVLVSTTPRTQCVWHPEYTYVEWGRDFDMEHAKIKPPEITPPVIINYGNWALDWIEELGGSAYFPTRMIFDKVEEGTLHVVPDVNPFTRSVWFSYREKMAENDWFPQILNDLKEISERLKERNAGFIKKWKLL
ncbi:LysR family transcriptional regulator [Roseovarius pelagicus]|uniref:LysR family transcriptional regulator n=1 Tax=Roseovarius pelagicus TaxID=2980108 RepID=A0ABY6D6N7_9RHOB|nr:LysR family transcriptional regulator [Roseovarius pelagicus]UXX81529.1 LysR family transcriptional regulator [Roseovarius pelagicus]